MFDLLYSKRSHRLLTGYLSSDAGPSGPDISPFHLWISRPIEWQPDTIWVLRVINFARQNSNALKCHGLHGCHVRGFFSCAAHKIKVHCINPSEYALDVFECVWMRLIMGKSARPSLTTARVTGEKNVLKFDLMALVGLLFE